MNETAETIAEISGNKMADKFAKLKLISNAKPNDVEEIGLSLEKRKETLNGLRII